MTLNGWLQIGVFLLAILAVTPPLGRYMARVFRRLESAFASSALRFIFPACAIIFLMSFGFELEREVEAIDQHNRRQHAIVPEAFLERRIVTGDDGVFRGLAPRAGRGRHGQHRQRRARELSPAADPFEKVDHRAAFGVRGHRGHGLG